MNPGVNLEVSLEPKELNKWQEIKLLNRLLPHLPFEISEIYQHPRKMIKH